MGAVALEFSTEVQMWREVGQHGEIAESIMTSRPEPERSGPATAQPAGAQIQTAADWRAKTLARMRRLVLSADADIVEESKWVKPGNPQGVPVWSRAGIVCTGETYKQVVKLTFARGASLPDPSGLFNASLDGNVRRAIDIREGQQIDADAFKILVLAAVAENLRVGAEKANRATGRNRT
jgi:hypothetical protein